MDALKDAYDKVGKIIHDIGEYTFFGLPAGTLLLWFAAGLVAGALVRGRRPLGLLGDLILGVLGGFVGGWLTKTVGFSIADHIQRKGDFGTWLSDFFHGNADQLTTNLATFLTALFGAIIVLIVTRILLRLVVKRAAS